MSGLTAHFLFAENFLVFGIVFGVYAPRRSHPMGKSQQWILLVGGVE
jgi:hypothetical protein